MNSQLDVSALVDNNSLDSLQALAEQFRSHLADVDAAIEVKEATLPLEHRQRQVMFPLFSDVFGTTSKAARKAFTRIVLDKAPDEPVSWADAWNGTITRREADKVIARLRELEAALAQ